MLVLVIFFGPSLVFQVGLVAFVSGWVGIPASLDRAAEKADEGQHQKQKSKKPHSLTFKEITVY
jgi:hypothetical protein